MAIIKIITNGSLHHPWRGSKAKLAAVLLAAALLMLAAAAAYNGLPIFTSSAPLSEAPSQSGKLVYEDTAGEVEAAVLPIPGTGGQPARFTTPLEVEAYRPEAARSPNQLQLQDFVGLVTNGVADQLAGVFVPGVLALRIVPQPANLPGYISAEDGEATQFAMASTYGSIGLLAHNYLAGASFFDVSVGQEITLVYGDGRTSAYEVTAIRRFQALTPESPYSAFLDLDNGNGYLTMQDVFNQTYGRSSVLLLQTCIEAEGIQTWGRFFVIAEPVGDA